MSEKDPLIKSIAFGAAGVAACLAMIAAAVGIVIGGGIAVVAFFHGAYSGANDREARALDASETVGPAGRVTSLQQDKCGTLSGTLNTGFNFVARDPDVIAQIDNARAWGANVELGFARVDQLPKCEGSRINTAAKSGHVNLVVSVRNQ